ncbi:peptidoglycan-binding protein [Streptomyces sp. NBC_01795]|uniref:peptidoglycan-binding domain-containing protein n=1 Tax=Streptomyces sp. NBC_01795 TaxID=2975943 RepID=UPI002DD97017|nr:peptidoglycan-binding protein [Streptomyces sp. NBC_01795]WSA94997.1 peptidoglycan-binding protein [Streptomyces sp. NBC_01795]
MTADERCPECGESARTCAHGAEHGHEPEDPLHIRPYVRLTEVGEGDGSEPGPGQMAASPGDGASGGTDGSGASGGAPAGAHVPLPDLSPFARQGTDETAELPPVSRKSGPKRRVPFTRPRHSERPEEPSGEPSGDAGTSGGARPSVDAAASEGSGLGSGSSSPAVSHRRDDGERRRPSTGVLAGVGVAAVLGAGLLTTQVLTGGEGGAHGGEERALRHTPTGVPTDDVPPSSSPSRGKSPGKSERPSAVPSRPSASGTPRAARDGEGHTAPAAPSRPPKSASARPAKTAEDQRPRPPRPGWPGHPSEGTLRPGDSGTEVAELQRRLKQAGFYDRGAEEDGVYSSEVQEGVFRYQARYSLFDDVPGDYGPVTRRHLEARTSD